MKLKQIIIVILSLFILSSGLWAQTAREIVNKCITALGGETAIRNFSNYKAAGELKLSFGQRQVSGKLTLIQKGEKYRMQGEVTFGSSLFTVVRAFDGSAGWMERMGTIVDQPALNYQSDADHTPSLLLEKEAAFSLAKETEIEGKKAVGIEVSFQGKKTIFFIDKTDYTILEILYKDLYFGRTQTKEMMEKRIRCLDYKKKGGAMFPFKQVFYQDGQKRMEIHFSEIDFNPTVSDEIFKRPDQELDLRYMEERLH